MKLLTLNTHSLIEPDYEAKRDAFVNFIAKELLAITHGMCHMIHTD